MKSVLLLHAGIADSSMWRPQAVALEHAGYDVLAPDLRGFGDRRLEPAEFSHVRDAEELLGGPAAIVGSSLGGRVALELAVLRPDLVERLAVIAPGLPGWDWSTETRAGWAEEEAAIERGNLERAAEISLRLWLDGPSRGPHEVDAAVRTAVHAMVMRSYEMQQGAWESGAEEVHVLGDTLAGRLGEIRCPTLVLVGEDDVSDMRAIATHVTDSIGGARLVTIPQAAHLPSVERPDAVNELLLAFLDER